jgi:hypothetical protein
MTRERATIEHITAFYKVGNSTTGVKQCIAENTKKYFFTLCSSGGRPHATHLNSQSHLTSTTKWITNRSTYSSVGLEVQETVVALHRCHLGCCLARAVARSWAPLLGTWSDLAEKAAAAQIASAPSCQIVA